MKKKIITKHENGVRVSDLAAEYGIEKLTISRTINIKNKEVIKGADVAKGVTVLSVSKDHQYSRKWKSCCWYNLYK